MSYEAQLENSSRYTLQISGTQGTRKWGQFTGVESTRIMSMYVEYRTVYVRREGKLLNIRKLSGRTSYYH